MSVGSALVAAAILVMEMEEVFVASMACFGAIWAKLANIFVFRSGISGTASMTKSTVERPSSVKLVEINPRASSAASRVRRCFATSFSSSLSIIECHVR